MMPQLSERCGRIIRDALRFFATPRGRRSSRFRRVVRYPSIEAFLITATCGERPLELKESLITQMSGIGLIIMASAAFADYMDHNKRGAWPRRRHRRCRGIAIAGV